MPADGSVTTREIARDVSKTLGVTLDKRAVLRRIERLHLMERCHIDPATNARMVPPDVASAVAHSLVNDPPKPRGKTTQRPAPDSVSVPDSDDSADDATDGVTAMGIVQEQARAMADSLERANETIMDLRTQNRELTADVRTLTARIEALNEQLRAADEQATQYRLAVAQLQVLNDELTKDRDEQKRMAAEYLGDASSMAYAPLRQRLLGFRKYQNRLPPPSGH